MGKKIAGIYISEEGAGFAVVEGRKVISSTYISLSLFDEDVPGSEFNPDLKMEALINRGIRELKSDIKDAYVGISDKYTFFRYLEIPLMNKKELQLALPLEIEKYIPFKIEDIAWDYNTKYDYRQKKIRISSLGIKKEYRDSWVSIFGRTNIGLLSLESGALVSLGSLFALNKIPPKVKNFSLFVVGRGYGEILVYSNNMPYFSRYTKFSADESGNINYIKVSDEINLALNYYRREIPGSPLETMFVLGGKENLAGLSDGFEKIDLPVVKIDSELLYTSPLPSIEEAMAASLALGRLRNKKFFFDLSRGEKEKPLLKQVFSEIASKDVAYVLWDFKPVLRILALSLVIFLGLLFFYSYQDSQAVVSLKKAKQSARDEIKKIHDDNLLKLFDTADIEQLKVETDAQDSVLSRINSVKQPGNYTGKLIKSIVEAMGPGLWFEKLDIKTSDSLKPDIYLKGYVYLNNLRKESKVLNSSISDLEKMELVSDLGLNVRLISTNRQEIDGNKVSGFEIKID